MNRKRRVVTVLLALAMALALTVPVWAGVTDVTGGGGTNTYTHTYHTKINAEATFTLKDGTAHTIKHESSDFVVGNISDEAAQAEIAAYYEKVNAYLAGNGAGLVLRSSTKELVFDHFESSNIIDLGGETILVGDKEDLEKAHQEGGVKKNLDVHEYQVYNITETYGVPVRSGGSAPNITAVLNGPTAKSGTDYSGGIYGLIFRASAAYSGFTGVQVDGKALDKSSYTAEDNGGTEVYLKAVYLRTLAAGKHTLTVQSAWGDMTTEFTVGGVMTAPKTFDAGIALYAGMAALSAGGVALWRRKD